MGDLNQLEVHMDKEAVSIFTAIHELKIDVPIMRYEIGVGVDGINPVVTLYLYGGQVVTWSPTRVETLHSTPKKTEHAPSRKPKPVKPVHAPAQKPKSSKV